MSDAMIRIGTRGSALALVQARSVAEGLAVHGLRSEIVIVETDGDHREPDTTWGEGAFVSAIEQRLADGEVDVAVHSAKDIPTDETPGLRVAAYLPRADPRDALVLRPGDPATSIDALPATYRVGTDSPRRTRFLLARRPDLQVGPLHGNVDTRLRRLDEGEVDALILATAGLVRLGRQDRIVQHIPATLIPPAAGQGAIAVQVRGDGTAGDAASVLDDPFTRLAVETERTFLRTAGGGCRSPIGALAEIDGDRLRLQGGMALEDGPAIAVGEVEGRCQEAETLAFLLVARLDGELASRTGHGRRRMLPDDGPTVLVTRAASQSAVLAERLADLGIRAVVVPAIAIEPLAAGGALDDALERLAEFDWAIVTSPNGARAVCDAALRTRTRMSTVRWAAVGDDTARELLAQGVRTVWRPTHARGAAIAAELPLTDAARVLLLRGSLADDSLPRSLRDRGASVTEVVAYRTLEAPDSSRPMLARALASERPRAVIFASGSAVRGLVDLASNELEPLVTTLPAICIGAATANEAVAHGFTVLAVAASERAPDLARLTARILQDPPNGARP